MQDRYRVKGGQCLDCVGDIVGWLEKLPGVRKVDVSSATRSLVLEHDGRASEGAVREQCSGVGLALEKVTTHGRQSERAVWWQQPRLIALLLAAGLFVFGFFVESVVEAEVLSIGLYLLTVAVGGFYPGLSAWRSLRTRRVTISTLLIAAAGGAVVLGVYEEAALLVVIFSLGEVLEEFVSDRARSSIRALMDLTPLRAQRVASDGSLESVSVESLLVGDIVVVRPGERLPTDGTVIEGFSAVDQSAITGESVPVEVVEGSVVFGGSVNGSGALRLEVTKPFSETVVSQIIEEVERAQASKSQAQRFAERFGAVYTPAMFVLSLVVAIGLGLLTGDFREWFYRGLVLLTVSCSCALVISVPVSIVAAVSRAARDGILIKGGVYLETLARVSVVAFDKTGTLTVGKPQLTAIFPVEEKRPDVILGVAAGVESTSEHPLAGAILTAASERGLSWRQGEALQATPGIGVQATVDGKQCYVGKLDGLGEAHEVAQREIASVEADGKTAVVVASEGHVLGIAAVSDKPRAGALTTVEALGELGIEQLVMLTGDNEQTAAAIAQSMGIEQWRANLLPRDKTAEVKRLREKFGPVAMVGDGINDAPALATADVGIAMGTAASDVALESCDIALMGNDLAKLPQAIGLARRAMRNIRQNIAMSLVTVAVLVLAAISGWLSLTTGLLLNEGAALLIIGNGLRLLSRPKRAVEPPSAYALLADEGGQA